MIKFKDSTLLMLDENGDTMPFQIEDLQAELVECFARGQLQAESTFAEDIALALEYVLLEQGDGKLFSVHELNGMVAIMLESAGFFDIAKIYREKNNFLEPLYKTDMESLKSIIVDKLGFPSANLETISKLTAEKFAACHIHESTLSLISEMVKYINVISSCPTCNEKLLASTAKIVKKGFHIKEKELNECCEAEFGTLWSHKIVKIGGISKMHCSIKLYINLDKYAEFCHFAIPSTELEVFSRFLDLSDELDRICHCIKLKCLSISGLDKNVDDIPVYLNFVDFSVFAHKYFDVDLSKNKKFGKELSEILLNGMQNPIYKVTFG